MGWGSVIDLSSKRALCVRRVAEVRTDVGSGVIGQVEGGCHDNSCRVCGRAGSLGLPFHIQEYLLTNYDKNCTSEIHVLCA